MSYLNFADLVKFDLDVKNVDQSVEADGYIKDQVNRDVSMFLEIEPDRQFDPNNLKKIINECEAKTLHIENQDAKSAFPDRMEVADFFYLYNACPKLEEISFDIVYLRNAKVLDSLFRKHVV